MTERKALIAGCVILAFAVVVALALSDLPSFLQRIIAALVGFGLGVLSHQLHTRAEKS